MKLCSINAQIVLSFAMVFFLCYGDAQGKQKLRAIDPSTASGGEGKKSKFEDLLESKDLSKFRGYQKVEIGPGWSLKGKEIVFDGTGEGDLITVDTFKDFELEVEWALEKKGGNSGIMFRVTLGDDQPYLSGPEFQILDDEGAKDGASALTSAGALYGLYPSTDEKVLKPVGKWNKSKIVVRGNKIVHFLNLKKVVDAESGSDDWNKRVEESKFKDWEKFNKAEEGHIAFQNHGDPVKFRNIRVKRLDGDDSEDSEKTNDTPGVIEPGAIDR